jgi:hypothetical protein
MSVRNICAPALIYLAFSLIQIVIDVFKMYYNTAFLKFWIMIIFTLLLNILCQRGLTVISWIIVFVPFMLMSVITVILLYILGMDPRSGKIKINDVLVNKEADIPDPRQVAKDEQTQAMLNKEHEQHEQHHAYESQLKCQIDKLKVQQEAGNLATA